MNKIIEKTVVSKYAPHNTNVDWLDVSGDKPVKKSYINGKWQAISGGGSSDVNYPVFSELETYYVGDKVTYNNKLYEFTETHEAGAWNETQVKEVSSTDIIDTSKMVEIHWEDLVELRDNAKLIPGTWYRIIDYVTTTSQENTRSAGHEFDIVVLALSKNTLSEDARAVKREHEENIYYDMTFSDNVTLKCSIVPYFNENSPNQLVAIVNIDTGLGMEAYVQQLSIDEGTKTASTNEISSEWLTEDLLPNTSYFYNAKLEAWRLKYCLDNDYERFNWADEVYTGVEFEEDGEKKSFVFEEPVAKNGNISDIPLIDWTDTSDTFMDNKGNTMNVSQSYSYSVRKNSVVKQETCDNGGWTYNVQTSGSTFTFLIIHRDGTGNASNKVYSSSTGTMTFSGTTGWLFTGEYPDKDGVKYKVYIYKPNTGNITSSVRVIRMKSTVFNSSVLKEKHTGVIYRMIDEFNNDFPYDFKNIQFKLGAITEDLYDIFGNMTHALVNLQHLPGISINDSDIMWSYSLAGNFGDNEYFDSSIYGYFNYYLYFPQNNKVNPNYNSLSGYNSIPNKQYLNNIIIGNCGYSNIVNVNLPEDCYGVMTCPTISVKNPGVLIESFIYFTQNHYNIKSLYRTSITAVNEGYDYKTINIDIGCNNNIIDGSEFPEDTHVYDVVYDSQTHTHTPKYYTINQLVGIIPSIEFTITTSGEIPDYITIDNAATSVVKGESYIAKLTCTSPDVLGSHSIMMGDYNVTTSVWNSVNAQTAVIYIPAVTGNIVINAYTQAT